MTPATHNGTSSPRDTAGVIAPPPMIFLGALGIGFGLDVVIGTGSLPSTVALPVGSASIMAGAGLLGSFVRAFGRARTPVDPYTPSQALVIGGDTRIISHLRQQGKPSPTSPRDKRATDQRQNLMWVLALAVGREPARA